MRRILLSISLICATLWAMADTIHVAQGSNTLYTAIRQSKANDVLLLAGGEYNEANKLSITHPLTISAAEGFQPTLRMKSRMELSANLEVTNLSIEADGATEALRLVPGEQLYSFKVRRSTIKGFSSKTIRVYNTDQEAAYIDSLVIDDCILQPSAGHCLEATAANKQVQHLWIRNSTFDGGAQGVGRFIYFNSASGTTVQSVMIDHCTFYNAQDTRGIYLGNIDGAQVSHCIFMNPTYNADYKSYCVYGSNTLLTRCISYNAAPYVRSGAQSNKVSTQNPYFVDANHGDFQLYNNSPATMMSADGTPIGDPRWGVSEQEADRSNEPYQPYKMPYTMAPTTSSIRVLWQMAEETRPTAAIVWYGTDKDNLCDSIVTDQGWMVADEGYMHIVDITGLQPNTRYYYQVGDLARRSEQVSSTMTAPEPGTAYRIFTISDIHGNAKSNWSNMQELICGLEANIGIFNGDHVSDVGADRLWNGYFFAPGEPFLSCTPIMSSAGNHETGVPSNKRWSSCYDYFWQFSHGESEDSITDPRGEAYFAFPYGNADVVVININGDNSSPLFTPGSKQYEWLDQTLEASTAPWIFIFGHVGIYTTGYHGQWSAEPKKIAPLLEKHAATGKRIIYFCGDDHSFEHLYKDGVHYVRPGCGRDANYAQQKQLVDYQYSLYYNQVSCFSMLDMSASGDTVTLQGYDLEGKVFYRYDFYRQANDATGTHSPAISLYTKRVENNQLHIYYAGQVYDGLGQVIK